MKWLDKFIVSERGQWEHPRKLTAVPTDNGIITMDGVPYPLFAMDETGYGGMIYPGGNYQFRGNMVYEIPMAQYGKQVKKSIVSAEELPEDAFPYEGTSAMFRDERYNIDRAKKLYTEDEFGHLPSIDYETGEWLKAKRYPTSWKEFLQYALNPEVNKLGFPTENKEGFLKYPNYANGGDISIPDLSRPNWLDKAQKGKQVKYYDNLKKYNNANQLYNDSLIVHNAFNGYIQDLKNSNTYDEWRINAHRVPRNTPRVQDAFGNLYDATNYNYGPSNTYTKHFSNNHIGYAQEYKRPTQKPVYKEKPKEYIPTKTVKLEREPVELIIPQSDRILDNYNNTLQVLRSIQKEDKSNQNLYPTRVVPAPDFRHGGSNKWLDMYQGDEGSSQVERRDPNQPFFPSSTEAGTYESQYSLPEVSIAPNWTEAELERNRLRDDYIAKDKKVWRHWYDKLGQDKDNVTKRANQFAYNKLAKQYLKGDKDQLTEEQRKFIEKSEYANRLQPSIASRFVKGITNPGFNLETLGNLAAPFEYPTNLVRGAVKGEFTDALIGQTPSPYFVSSDLAGTSPNEAAIASGLVDFGADAGIGAIDVATPMYKGIDALSNLRKTIGDSDFFKAITPYSKRKMTKERNKLMEDWKDLTYNKMAEANDEVFDAEQAAYKKQNNPSIGAYAENKPFRSGPYDNTYDTYYKKKIGDKTYNIGLTDGLRSDNGEIIAENINPFFMGDATSSPVLTSGSKEIVDLKSGNLISAKVDPAAFRSRAQLTTGPDGKKLVSFLDESVDSPKVNDDYINTLQNNIQYIEETVPGAKVFGSSKGISEGNLPHLSSDYDVLISETDYAKNVKNKYPEKGVVGSAHKHDISKNPSNTAEDYVLDFNIIHENPDGTVKPVWIETGGGRKSSREIELFRQAFPEEFFEASRESILSGKPIKINKTANELIDRLDPAVKTIMDSYESTKTKHLNRVDAYINYGDPRKVASAQESFVKSIVGGKGSVGHQFDASAFNDIDNNKTILNDIGFVGNIDAVSKDPARMQLALNDFYINSTVLTRAVDTQRLGNIKNIENALKNWNYKDPNGTFSGAGLNHVKLGSPFDTAARPDSSVVMGNKQLGLDLDTSNIDKYIDSIKRQTDGSYILDNDELTVVRQLMDESFGPKVSKHFENKRNVSSYDLIRMHLDERELYSDLVTGTNDYTKYHKFNQNLEKNLGIRSVSGIPYGNSTFSATLSDFNEKLDALGYAANENMPTLKSASDRKKNFEFRQRRAKSIDSVEKTINSENFKLIEGYLSGGREKAMQRLETLAKEKEYFRSQVSSLRQKYAKKEIEKVEELKRKLNSLNEESGVLSRQLSNLSSTLTRVDEIRKNLLLATGAAPLVGLTGYFLSDLIPAAAEPENKEATQKLYNNFIKPGAGFVGLDTTHVSSNDPRRIPKEKYGGWLDNNQDYNYIKYKDLSLSRGTGWLDNYK